MTIEKSIEIYLAYKASTRTTAHKRYKIRLDQFADFLRQKGKLQLKQINGDDITAYHNQMKLTYSRTTVAYSGTILKNFFQYWSYRQHINLNPKEIEIAKFRSPIKPLVNDADFKRINTHLKNDNLKDLQRKLAINLLWDTGMRVSELVSLQLSNIKEPKSNGLRSAYIDTCKLMDNSLVTWGEQTNEILNCYLGIRLCMDTPYDELLINPKTKKPFTTRSIQRWIKELQTELGIEKNITPHSFRHTKADSIIENGGDVTEVATVLRHSNPISSFKYLRKNENRHLKTAGKYLEDATKPQLTDSDANFHQRLLEQNNLLLELLKMQHMESKLA